MLAEWFRAQDEETNAAKVNLSRSKWHGLRDQSFKDQLESLAQGVTGGVQAAASMDYGVIAVKVTALTKEIKDYADMMASPQAGIDDRKSLMDPMRAKFNAVEGKFDSLDNLIFQFNGKAVELSPHPSSKSQAVCSDFGHGRLMILVRAV